MVENKTKKWKQSLGLSALIHAVVVFSSMAVIGHAAVTARETITIVLDGQVYFNPDESYRIAAPGPQSTQVQIPAQKTPLRRHAVSAPDQRVDLPETRTNDASAVVMAANENEPAHLFDPSDYQTSPIASAGTGLASDAQAFAGKAQIGAGDATGSAYMKAHFNFIRELIKENLAYPHMARKMGWCGAVTVSFTICEGGLVENIRIVKSSGHKILDESIVETIRRIQPFPRPPVRAQIIIPIEYRFG